MARPIQYATTTSYGGSASSTTTLASYSGGDSPGTVSILEIALSKRTNADNQAGARGTADALYHNDQLWGKYFVHEYYCQLLWR